MSGGQKTDFVEVLSLRKEVFHSLPLDQWVGEIAEFAETVLEGPCMDAFVDHGINHGRRVVERALDVVSKVVPSDFRLSPLERALLGAAGLIHDIGMQFNRYCEPSEVLSEDEVRARHCELGSIMMRDVVRGRGTSRGLPGLHVRQEYALLFDHLENIAFGHCSVSGREFWEKLSYWEKERSEAGQRLRAALLGALLRLGDELDQDFQRIRGFDRIDSSSLSPVSKAHWCACYYVRDVHVTGGPGGFRVHLRWTATDDEQEVELVRSLLEELRVRHLNDELKLVSPRLCCDSSVGAPTFDARIAEEPELSRSTFRLPTAVRQYISQDLLPFRYGNKKAAAYHNLKEISGGGEIQFAKSRASAFLRSGEGAIAQHFVLATTWHTDRYVMCRELVSDAAFAEALASGLAERYAGAGITHVVAIGTSAIRIGALVALKLVAELQYAYGGVRFSNGDIAGPDPRSFGQAILAQPGARVLVIDDILGVGSVLAAVVRGLRSHGASSIEVFCIYSLGDSKDFIGALSDVDVGYLVAFPDVKYWEPSDDGLCQACRGRPEIRNYESPDL